ncbi:MAG: hypothetical protein JKY70_22475 [Mucilaginibacter sp.]|nr:hypothetical protein [Mucilaginibacter sp.]
MKFISKLYIFSNLLEQADNHKQLEDSLFQGFGGFCRIQNPKDENSDGQLFISKDADIEARLILNIIWREAMDNFNEYPVPGKEAQVTHVWPSICLN